MPILIRVDDFGSGLSQEWALKWLKLCKKYNIKTTLGVIPYYQQKFPDVNLLKQFLTQEHGVILHGYTHECHYVKKHKKMDDRWHEFVCLDKGPIPFGIQTKWIREGKELLQDKLGIPCHSFLSPQHDIDDNTLRALKKNGFRILSEQNKHRIHPYKVQGFKVFPVQLPEFTNSVIDKRTFNEQYKRVSKNFLDDYAKSGYYGVHFHIGSLNPLRFKFWEKLLKLFSKEETMTISELDKRYKL